MRSIFTFLISGFLLIGASSSTRAQFITPEQTSVNVTNAAGTTSVNVASDVAWTPSTGAAWITSVSNNGAGALVIEYAENTSIDGRSGDITLTDGGSITATVTVNQDEAPLSISVFPDNQNVSTDAGTTSFTVTANFSDWVVNESESWLSASKNGSTIDVNYDANGLITGREGTITISRGGISDIEITVTQAGATPTLTVLPSNQDVTSAAGITTFTATSNFTTWTPSESENWLTVSKNGNDVNVTYEENTLTSERVGTVTVSGEGITRTVTVTQAGVAAYIIPDETTVNVGSGDSQTSIGVSSNVTWNVNESVTWLTATKNGVNLSIDYDANSGTSSRNGIITLNSSEGASATVTVVQAGSAAYITPDASTVNISSGDSQTSLGVSSNVTWTVSANVAWITPSNNGSGQLIIDYDANSSISERSGTVTLTDGSISAPVTVIQAGSSVYITPSQTTLSPSSASGETTVTVSSNVSWAASSNASWLTYEANGSDLTIMYEANETISSRIGAITLTGSPSGSATITVTQSGAAASLSVDPSSRTAVKEGETVTFAVTSNISWSAIDNADWVALSTTSNQISAVVSANNTVSSRIATITVSGSGVSPVNVTITQNAGDATLTITPSNHTISYDENDVPFDVSSNTTWSASENSGWLSIPSTTANQFWVHVAENITIDDRTGTVTVTAGSLTKEVTVTQSGVAPILTVPSTVHNVASSTGSSAFTVNANFTTWTAAESSSWFSIMKGINQVNVTYSANTSADSRTDTVTISGEGITRKVAVVQEGAPPSLDLEPETKSVTYPAGSTSFTVAANFTDWTVSKTGDWITSATKSGNTVNVVYSVNGTVVARTGKIIVSGRGVSDTVAITQSEGLPYITITPLTRNVSYQQGTTTFIVDANVTWNASESVTWITSAGRNVDTIIVSYELNNAITSREGKVTVTGGGLTKEATVIQGAAPAYITPDEATVNVGYASGTYSVNVGSNVAWTVSESSSWFSAVKSGTQVNITYDANLTITQRTGTINLNSTQGGSATITVIQAAGLPFITPESEAVSINSYTSGNTSVNITANIAWTASESSDWFDLTYTANSITITYTENMTISSRTGNITVTGSGVNKTISVAQIAGPERLAVAPESQTLNYMEGDASFAVESNVSWSVSESLNWLITTKETNRFLVGVVENTSADPRTGNITVKGSSLTRVVSVTQSGAPASVDAEPENTEVDSAAGSTAFTVVSNFSNWTVSDDAAWLTAVKSGLQVNVSYQENETVNARIGKIIISGRGVSDTVTVTQHAGHSDLNVTPLNRNVSYAAGETTFSVTANVEWNITEEVSWLTAVKNGSQITVSFEANTSTNSRTGNFTLSGGTITHTLSVMQEGIPETIVLTPGSVEVEYTAGTSSFNVAVNTDSWSVSENVSWLAAAISGLKANITYEENASVNSRSGKITVTAGDSSKVFTITQKGTPTAISAEPGSANVSFHEGGVSFTITANVEWDVSETVEWLTAIKNGSKVDVNYAKNGLREQRQGVVTVSGGGYSKDIIITQGGNLEVGKPSLTSPANNAYKSGLNLIFQWTEPALADTYTLEISDSAQFTNIIYSYNEITEHSYTIASLKEGVKYFWRIKASNSYGYFTYSDVWSFTSKLLQAGNLRISQNAFNEVILSWQDNSKNETGYDILRKKGDEPFAKLISVPSGQVNYIDAEIHSSGQYTYRVYAYNGVSVSDTSEVFIIITIIGIDDDPLLDIPTEYSLSNAYPNPFNPSSTVKYGLPEESAVVIEIFNILGEKVETLLNEQVSAGYHEAKWNASSMPSGIYIIRTYAKSTSSGREFVSVKKAMLLK